MRNVLLITMFLASCANVNQDLECEIQSNGYIDGVDGEVKMGNASAIEVFNEMGHPTTRFLASDGGSNSNLWMQIWMKKIKSDQRNNKK